MNTIGNRTQQANETIATVSLVPKLTTRNNNHHRLEGVRNLRGQSGKEMVKISVNPIEIKENYVKSQSKQVELKPTKLTDKQKQRQKQADLAYQQKMLKLNKEKIVALSQLNKAKIEIEKYPKKIAALKKDIVKSYGTYQKKIYTIVNQSNLEKKKLAKIIESSQKKLKTIKMNTSTKTKRLAESNKKTNDKKVKYINYQLRVKSNLEKRMEATQARVSAIEERIAKIKK